MKPPGSALRLALISACVFLMGAYNFKANADEKFGDQNLKTAIALVELYKVRHGEYPASLTDLDFAGGWDRVALSAVDYKRDGTGYELNIVRGWVGKPSLSYPPEFWKGLGVTKSNAKNP